VSASCLTALTPEKRTFFTHLIADCLNPKACLNTLEKRKPVLLFGYEIKQVLWIGHVARMEMHPEFWRGNQFQKVVKY
jgi:hypothetical protein